MAFAPLTAGSLVDAVLAFFDGYDERARRSIRAAVEREIDAAGPESVRRLSDRLAEDDGDWAYHPPDPLARRIHHALADLLLQPDSGLRGAEHLAALDDAPVVLLGNHLSYSDANLLEVLLHGAGAGRVASRLTAMAGPKVYTSRKRRFSSLCFGTIKTPQSADVSSEDAVMNPRDVARAARRVIELAHDRLRAGDALVVYAEGTRSRTTQMQRHLAGAARYLDGPAEWLVPVGMTGTEALFPIDRETLQPVRVTAVVGRPIRVGALHEATGGDRRLIMDVAGLAIAALLPREYRGAYGDGVPALDEARQVLGRVMGAWE